LNEKVEILNFLLSNYNDGKRKNFYCTAVNLLKLEDLKNILVEFKKKIKMKDITAKEKIEFVISFFKDKAEKEEIEIELRK
jgi:F0F1-type ATP synthase delta subunit